jgi:hypothetical protein
MPTTQETRCTPPPASSAACSGGLWNESITAGVYAIIHGGFDTVTVANAYAFIVSPVDRLVIQRNNANIYGLVLGGKIDLTAVNGATFYSLGALTYDSTTNYLPGISDNATLQNINLSAAAAYEGTTVSLLNLPVIYSSKEGIR